MLVTVQLTALPQTGGAIVLHVDETWSRNVALLQQRVDGWHLLPGTGTWQVPLLLNTAMDTLTLGINVCSWGPTAAPAPLHPANGFDLSVSVVDESGERLAENRLTCRVAPFLLASALDPVEELYIVRNPMTEHVVDTLRAIVPQTSAMLSEVTVANSIDADVWMQDTVEIGRFCLPTADGVQQVPGVLTGLRTHDHELDCKPLDRGVRAYFNARNMILIDAGERRPDSRWIDWYGNLELSPPVTTQDGRHFPYGRILTGRQHELGLHPDVMAFLERQQVQWPPVIVDTSWLLIGHVDEVVNFVPAANEVGFRVLMPSVYLAKAILNELAWDGLDDLPVFAGCSGEMSVEQLTDEIAVSVENQQIEETLRAIKAMLCRELGLVEEHFIDVPTLFKEGMAVIPNMVNGVTINGHYILPDPHGPVVDGVDVFAAQLQRALSKLGMAVHVVDDWEPYHVREGELHCGTNALRRLNL